MKNMKETRIVLVSLPYAGHANPMMELAKQLSERGVQVIYTNTAKWVDSLSKNNNGYGIKFYPYLDELTFSHKDLHGDDQMDMIRKHAPSSLRNLMSDKENPVSCIVYNAFTPWVLDVAANESIPTASFWTQSAASFILHNFILNNYSHEEGVVKIPEEVHIQGLPKFTKEDIPSHISPDSPFTVVREMAVSQFKRLAEATWVLANTVEKLELEEIEIAKTMKPQADILAVGPLVPRDNKESAYPWNRAYNCSEWLDARNPKGVVYVAFGSIVEISEVQNEEIAKGLLSAGLPFLWVKRSKKEGEECRTPECLRGLKEEQGLVVEWCNQKEVLSHESIGVFVSHCGWNSSLEAISLGVPFICCPQSSDQTLNAKYISQTWKNGICLRKDHEGIFRGDEIQKCIVDAMKGEVGAVVRANGDLLKTKVMQDMSLQGSSNHNIDRFISEAANWRKLREIGSKENGSEAYKS